MWKPALFLITIVVVTPNGRNFLGEYARQATALMSVNSTYADLALIALALVVLGLFLLMFCQSPNTADSRWIRHQVREDVAGDTNSHQALWHGRG
jgi:hypothetical protein